MIVRSRAILPMTGAPFADGAVAVEGGTIRAVGRFDEVRDAASGPVIDLGSRLLMPGLINAHCHLDFTMMRWSIPRPHSFTDWIRRINALKRSLSPEEYVAAIARGFAELKRWGATSVLNIESFPELLLLLPPPPLRTWWFYEMIDIRLRIHTDESMAGAMMFFEGREDWLGGFGLSPHAPYTASPELYRRTVECAQMTGMPVTTHVAESSEEDWMFRDRAGALYEFLKTLGRDMSDCAGRSAFANLVESGGIDSETILVHLNELRSDDFRLLEKAPLQGRLQVVHCPRSHEYFNHRPFQYERLRNAGATISLGTDSLASCDSLNLFDEMRQLRNTQPALSAEEIVRTVTVNPASALKMNGRLGCLGPGAAADMIALPFEGEPADAYEGVVAHERPIDWMMINGNVVTQP